MHARRASRRMQLCRPRRFLAPVAACVLDSRWLMVRRPACDGHGNGESGAIYGIRLLEVLRGAADIQTHVVPSPAARRRIALETDVTIDYIHSIADTVYRPGDVAAAISYTFVVDALLANID